MGMLSILDGLKIHGMSEALKQIFESTTVKPTNMSTRQSVLFILVMLIACFVPTTNAIGRAIPSCQTMEIASIPSIIDVNDGACVVVELGQLEPTTVHEFEFIIVDDAIDVLFFDENAIQVYNLGQSYRGTFDQVTSTESANGSMEFHWQVPASISAKSWFIVLDNLAHDGDGGQGDQGGNTSKVGLEWQVSIDSYWTPYHNVAKVDANQFQNLLTPSDMVFDQGTVISISVWALEGTTDIYLQTESIHSTYASQSVGVQYVTGGALQDIDDSGSLTYIVPQDLDGQGLYMVLDNTDTPLGGGDGSQLARATVKIELSPPLSPVILSQQSSISTNEVVEFSAQSTPNSLNQVESYSWDFDESVDVNDDGSFTNDQQDLGEIVSYSWSTIGQKSVTLTAHGVDGRTATTQFNITVVDTEPPEAVMDSSAIIVNQSYRLQWGQSATFSCLDSTDNIQISACQWNIDGSSYSENTTISVSWSTIGSHDITLNVVDSSGNTEQLQRSIFVVDSSIPIFSNQSLDELPTQVNVGDAVRMMIDVTDEYDVSGQLTVHWDVKPTVDDDNNGNPRDDPDYIGLNPRISFEKEGLQDIVITVFDASNNSQTHAFSVKVDSVDEASSQFQTYIAIGTLLLLVMGIVAITVFRVSESRKATSLLVAMGLPEDEALSRIEMVRQKRKIPFFARADFIAGIDLGEVKTQQAIEEEQRKKEIESIYGTASASPSIDQQQFQPTPQSTSYQMSAPASEAAMEAASLLGVAPRPTQNAFTSVEGFEDLFDGGQESPSQQPIDTFDTLEVETTKPSVDNEVALPSSFIVQDVNADTEISPDRVDHTSRVLQCPSCQVKFEIDVPGDLNHIIVECPGCKKDQSIHLS